MEWESGESHLLRLVRIYVSNYIFFAFTRNGFGGKIEANESVEEAALRELQEECGLIGGSLNRLGYLVFKMQNMNLIMRVHVFESWDFSGVVTESEEMRPMWFNEAAVPFEKMWLDDIHWFPFLLAQKRFVGR